MTISTNASLSTLRPKNMVQLYANQIVYLLRKGNVLHLVWGVTDPFEVEGRLGETIAEFYAYYPKGQQWRDSDDVPITQKELGTLIGDGEICMMGKDCLKHKGKL